jgi:uncharacterized protein (TIGR00251 family)
MHPRLSIEIRPAKGGCQLPVRVRPRAGLSAIEGVHGGALKVSVREPPEDGKANRAVRRLLASVLQIPTGSVTLISGARSREKLLLIVGLSEQECRDRLALLLRDRKRGDLRD